jgi:hypothetical protein
MRRRRDERPGRFAGRGDALRTADASGATAEPKAINDSEPTESHHGAPSVTAESAAIARRRREAGRSQDLASYTCQCGFVFEALVSTSVDCPHCGDPQAW